MPVILCNASRRETILRQPKILVHRGDGRAALPRARGAPHAVLVRLLTFFYYLVPEFLGVW